MKYRTHTVGAPWVGCLLAGVLCLVAGCGKSDAEPDGGNDQDVLGKGGTGGNLMTPAWDAAMPSGGDAGAGPALLPCASAVDCAVHPEAVACSGGYCVDGSGVQVWAIVDPQPTGDCEGIEAQAENQQTPADILIVVDQSGSMSTEASYVQAELNQLARGVIRSGIDPHVILLAQRVRGSTGILIDPPLAGPGGVDDSPRFTQIEASVNSRDALSVTLAQYPNYAHLLRPEASKHVVVISDDNSSLSAQAFDTAFRALGDGMILSEYQLHSIVAVRSAPPGETDICDGLIASEGRVYVELSDLTGGVRGDLCDQANGFSAVWRGVTDAVLQVSELTCQWAIPDPDGISFDPERVNVEYTLDGGEATAIGYLADPASCEVAGGGWYYDDEAMPSEILVCPETCESLQGHPDLEFDVRFGCDRVPALQ